MGGGLGVNAKTRRMFQDNVLGIAITWHSMVVATENRINMARGSRWSIACYLELHWKAIMSSLSAAQAHLSKYDMCLQLMSIR